MNRPVKRAVALRYEKQQDSAPRVLAKGSGDVASAILRLAEQNDLAVYEDEALVQSLMALEVDSVIPEELYAAIAEILAFVYKQKGR